MGRILACLVLLTLVPLASADARQARPRRQPNTHLRIRVQTPPGYPDPPIFKRAELLLGWWDGTDEVTLIESRDAQGPFVEVPLGQAVWNDLRAVEAPQMAAVLVEYEGFAPMVSQPFPWIGSYTPNQADYVADIDVGFRGEQAVHIHQGDVAELVLPLRRPLSRQLRFVDDEGNPVTDITVTGGIFWSADTKCGLPAGDVRLFDEMRPNPQGILSVPDGDFEYGFELHEAQHLRILTGRVFQGSANFFTTELREPEQVVHLHRFARVPLHLQVNVGGRPAAGAVVTIDHQPLGACGFDGGDQAKTDEHGLLASSDFFPEAVTSICLGDDRGELLWSTAQFDGKAMTVDLPEGTILGRATSCAPGP